MVARATISVKDASEASCCGQSARGGVSRTRASQPRTARRRQGGVKKFDATGDLVSLSVGEPADEEHAVCGTATIVFRERATQRFGAGW